MFNTLTSSHHCLVAADSLRLTWCTCSRFTVTTRTTCCHTAELLDCTCVTNFIVLIFGAPLLLSTHSSLAMIKHYFPTCGNEFFPSKRSSCFLSGFQCWFPLGGVWFFSHPFPFMVSFVLLSPFSPPSVAVPPSTRHAKGSRRRQKGSDYTSTSDEEYDSNQSTPKYKRSQPPSASHSPRSQPRPRPQPVVALHPKGRTTDSEDDRRENEAHGWSNHSAEIAR